MRLYFHPGSPNARKPRALARQLGLELEEHLVDVPGGANRTPEYLALNPNGKVPVLVDGARTIWESSAICTHLAWESDLLPTGRDGAIEVVRWVAWNHAHFAPPIGRLVFQQMFSKSPDEGAVAQATTECRRTLGVLDGHLTERPWILGASLSMLDFVLGAELTYAAPARVPLADFPEVGRWLGALDELPAWRDTAPPRH